MAKLANFTRICNRSNYLKFVTLHVALQYTTMHRSTTILHANQHILAATTQRGEEANREDSYSGFSLCHYTGDNTTHYGRCLRQLAAFAGVAEERVIVPRQTHSTNVHVVTAANIHNRFPTDCDALVTTLRNVVAGINTADCVPVLLYDETAGVVAAAHAGWRGAVNGIIGHTVAAMASCGASADRIEAIICPAICVRCFEVGEEVARQFPATCVVRHDGTKPHVDLPAYVKLRLMETGLRDGHINMTGQCTRCNPLRYFSARAIGINSGRNYSFVMLR